MLNGRVRLGDLTRGTTRGFVACLVALMFVQFGCPHASSSNADTLPQVTTTNANAEHAFNEARAAQTADDMDRAAALYEAFLVDYSDDALVPTAKLYLGQVYLRRNEVPRARVLFEEAAQSTHAPTADRASFYRGVALEMLGDHATARGLLAAYVGRTVDPADTAMLLRNLASAEQALGAHGEALTHLDALLREPLAEVDRVAVRARIDALVRAELSDDELQNAADSLAHDGYSWSVVAGRALTRAFENGNMTRVRVLAAELHQRGIELTDEMQSMNLRASLPDTASPDVIGVVLPLSGPAREIGQRALRALMLASGVPSDRPLPPGSPRIVYRDTMGDPHEAVRAVEDLVSLHRAIAIIGPIDGQEALAASQRAAELRVPLVTLTPVPGITTAGNSVFRLFSDAGAEAHALVEAARARGARSFAIVHPDSPAGVAMTEPYLRAISDLSGTVALNQGYPATTTAFGPLATQLQAASFDALIIADTSRTTALLLPTLATAGIWASPQTTRAQRQNRTVIMLGSSLAFDASLLRTTTRYVEGIIFSLPFYAPLATGAGRRFADSFQAVNGTPPDVFAAFAFDAFTLVHNAIDGGARTRADLIQALAHIDNVETVTAAAGFTSSREPVHATRIYVVAHSSLAPL